MDLLEARADREIRKFRSARSMAMPEKGLVAEVKTDLSVQMPPACSVLSLSSPKWCFHASMVPASAMMESPPAAFARGRMPVGTIRAIMQMARARERTRLKSVVLVLMVVTPY